jgi:hypothetical protein
MKNGRILLFNIQWLGWSIANAAMEKDQKAKFS